MTISKLWKNDVLYVVESEWCYSDEFDNGDVAHGVRILSVKDVDGQYTFADAELRLGFCETIAERGEFQRAGVDEFDAKGRVLK